MRTCLAVACIVAAFGLSACKSESKPAADSGTVVKTANKTCPVSGKDVDPAVTRTWKGTTIGFCCNHCPATFDKMTDAEKDNVVTLAKTNKTLAK